MSQPSSFSILGALPPNLNPEEMASIRATEHDLIAAFLQHAGVERLFAESSDGVVLPTSAFSLLGGASAIVDITRSSSFNYYSSNPSKVCSSFLFIIHILLSPV